MIIYNKHDITYYIKHTEYDLTSLSPCIDGIKEKSDDTTNRFVTDCESRDSVSMLP